MRGRFVLPRAFAKLRAPPKPECVNVTSNKIVLALCVATTLLAGCKPKEAATPAAEATPAPAAEAPTAQQAATAPQAPSATPAAAAFDIGKIPVSDKPLPAWPYVAPPAGYHYYRAEDMAGQSKDLARVPVWTGGQLLWVEGKVFSDGIDNADGKTFSRFELAKGLRQQIEALGGVRVSERSYDRDFYTANEKALDDFRQEFDDLQDAYWYDKDVDTYAIRRADGVVWVVLQTRNDDAAVLVAEGPAPALD